MSKVRKYLQFIIWGAVTLVLVAVLIVANVITGIYAPIITIYLGQSDTKLITEEIEGEDTEYFKSEFKKDDRLTRAGEKLCEEIVEEGAVLLENNGALPLKNTEKNIHFFSLSSYDFVTGGVGSGSIDDSTSLRLRDVFGNYENGRFTVNNTLWDYYYSNYRYGQRHYAQERQGVTSGSWAVGDLDASTFPENIKNSYRNKSNDVAVTVIARMGGEGSDLPNYVYYKADDASLNEGTEHFLQLTTKEKNTLKEVGGSGFGKHIVIVNTSNPMELGWISDPEYKIDAVLLIPNVGKAGLTAIPEIFDGAVNPSGRLVDTWAYNVKSSPAAQNIGNHTFTNAEAKNVEKQYDKYVVYQEGIYVGYRYYETRYYDKQTNAEKVGDYDYAATVQYPFGYGKSYTDFALSDFAMKENADGDFELSVKVTNVGEADGKCSVQFYMSAPYHANSGVERAAVELVEFGKTRKLDKTGGDRTSDTITVTVPKDYLKAYDAKTGNGGYVVQSGDYYFTAALNAHDATNNVLAAKEGKTELGNAELTGKKNIVTEDRETYKYSEKSGKKVAVDNKFQNADLTKLGYDNFKYLTRSDWVGTFPTEQQLPITDAVIAQQVKTNLDEVPTNPDAKMPTMNGGTETLALQLMGKDFEDPLWGELLDRMSFDEMAKLIQLGGYKTEAVPSIAFNTIGDQDGPAGISGTLIGAGSGCMAYPSEAVVGMTFNKNLVDRFGELVGEDALRSEDNARKLAGWYAPAVNIHRTPFSGRNYEYYSEDPVLNGIMAKYTINAASRKGVVTFLKHFAFNDQETNRNGLNTFGDEQTLREIYLRPFEIAVTGCDKVVGEGMTKHEACTAIMSSYNRIGGTWTGGYKPLITGVLREEWGFTGRVLSDYIGSDVCESYISVYDGLLAGNDQFLNTNTLFYSLSGAEKNATVVSLMRESCHRILYSAINSAGMNGIGRNTRVERIIPTWKALLIAGTVVISVGLAVWGGLITFFFIKKNKKKDGEEQPTETENKTE
ncbi:MAG: glycoside hydrolase family 3 C-terminal domain-containing protein [Clostridia bacterium]|nr:glycoside hydrolase family 3 C-terminal domain-containing protein [Clostridia bacterium]